MSDQTFCYLPAASSSLCSTNSTGLFIDFLTHHQANFCLSAWVLILPAKLQNFSFKYPHDQLHYFIQLFQSTVSLDYFPISYRCFAFMPQWQSEVVKTETVRPTNPKIFTICPCTEKLCPPIFPLSIYHYVACSAFYLFFHYCLSLPGVISMGAAVFNIMFVAIFSEDMIVCGT